MLILILREVLYRKEKVNFQKGNVDLIVITDRAMSVRMTDATLS